MDRRPDCIWVNRPVVERVDALSGAPLAAPSSWARSSLVAAGRCSAIDRWPMAGPRQSLRRGRGMRSTGSKADRAEEQSMCRQLSASPPCSRS
jgi:hypothetical protein